RWVEITGAIFYEPEQERLIGIEYHSHEVSSEDVMAFDGCYDKIASAEILSELPPLIDLNPTKYAVLYSGGINSFYSFYRYWNDMIWMYWILRLFGYDEDNIFVIYKDGTGENGQIPVHYNASHASMDTVFANLSAKMDRSDSLFFYVTNHGSSNGIDGYDAIDAEPMTHTEVAGWLDSITCYHMTVVMEQCVSGAFLPYLSALNRIIITACGDDESSWSCDDEGEWDEFVFHFMSALLQFRINGDGIPVYADITGEGDISIAEAFGYAATMDSRSETPLYDDNGDGVGSTVNNIIGTDGNFGAGIYL
ncbi:MAG: C13 family peptidase, partial [Candidatus Thorarchaeota archaeon]